MQKSLSTLILIKFGHYGIFTLTTVKAKILVGGDFLFVGVASIFGWHSSSLSKV